MDPNRFDTLARSVTGASSRRRAVRLLLGSAVGGLLGGVAAQETDAHDAMKKCKRYKKRNGQDWYDNCVKNAKKHNAVHLKSTVGIFVPPIPGLDSPLPPAQLLDTAGPPPPPPPVCNSPSTCQLDADCCGTDFCSCGEPRVCVQAGSLGTGACCKQNAECLQQCVVLPSGSHGVCCDPAAPETCVCANCPPCVAFNGACTQSSDCCRGVPCTNFTCRYP